MHIDSSLQGKVQDQSYMVEPWKYQKPWRNISRDQNTCSKMNQLDNFYKLYQELYSYIIWKHFKHSELIK